MTESCSVHKWKSLSESQVRHQSLLHKQTTLFSPGHPPPPTQQCAPSSHLLSTEAPWWQSILWLLFAPVVLSPSLSLSLLSWLACVAQLIHVGIPPSTWLVSSPIPNAYNQSLIPSHWIVSSYLTICVQHVEMLPTNHNLQSLHHRASTLLWGFTIHKYAEQVCSLDVSPSAWVHLQFFEGLSCDKGE